MPKQGATIGYKTLKGSPGSGTSEGGPKNAATTKSSKRKADYCGIMDSRPENSDRRQSAK